MFLESAGRSDAIASDTEGAVGLTQILAETGQNLLGMKIDVAAQPPLHAPHPPRAAARARCSRSSELQRARARVDQRFDPAQALPATARYLKLAKDRFEREDLAFVSLPHGHGQPRERPARLRRADERALHPGLLRLDARSATPPPTRSSPRSATTPRTTCGSSAPPSGSCALSREDAASSLPCRPRRPPRSRPRRCCTRRARRRASRPPALQAAWDDGRSSRSPRTRA